MFIRIGGIAQVNEMLVSPDTPDWLLDSYPQSWPNRLGHAHCLFFFIIIIIFKGTLHSTPPSLIMLGVRSSVHFTDMDYNNVHEVWGKKFSKGRFWNVNYQLLEHYAQKRQDKIEVSQNLSARIAVAI